MRNIFLLSVILLYLTGCGDAEKSVSLFLYNSEDPFIHTYANQINEESATLFNLETFDSQNSQIIQNEYIEQEINKKVDLMIINPVDRLGAYSIIKKLRSLDIPVIFFNREPLVEDLDLWDKAYYVGARAEQSGQIQAEMIMDLFGNDPDHLNQYDINGNGMIETVILKGEQGHQDAEIRTSEVLQTFKKNGFKLEILAIEVANWSREEGYEKMEYMLEEFNGSIELVISNNDAMALGALRSMRDAGMFLDTNGNHRVDQYDELWVPVVGIDGLEEAVAMIDQGYLYGSVYNDSLAQAKAVTELADCLLNDKDFSTMSFDLIDGKYIWIDYKVINKNSF